MLAALTPRPIAGMPDARRYDATFDSTDANAPRSNDEFSLALRQFNIPGSAIYQIVRVNIQPGVWVGEFVPEETSATTALSELAELNPNN